MDPDRRNGIAWSLLRALFEESLCDHFTSSEFAVAAIRNELNNLLSDSTIRNKLASLLPSVSSRDLEELYNALQKP